MSSPSYALMYNENNEEISKFFINVGWFFSERNLFREIYANIEKLQSTEYASIKLYEYTLKKEHIDAILKNYDKIKVSQEIAEKFFKLCLDDMK